LQNICAFEVLLMYLILTVWNFI